MKPEVYFAPLKVVLEVNTHSEGVAYMKSYMKGQFDFYGWTQQPRRVIFNEFVKLHRLCDYENLNEHIKWLYNQPQREYDYCAMELLLKFKKKWDDSLLDHAKYLIVNNSWWDKVDLTATNIVGAYLKKNLHLIETIMPDWIESDNKWLNRTAMIFQLKYKIVTSTYWLEKSILPHIESKEFFHQKAIGLVLRQYSRHNPDWVVEFVNENELKPLSRREAIRLL